MNIIYVSEIQFRSTAIVRSSDFDPKCNNYNRDNNSNRCTIFRLSPSFVCADSSRSAKACLKITRINHEIFLIDHCFKKTKIILIT